MRDRFGLAVTALVLATIAAPATAQSYPTRPVRLIAPFAPVLDSAETKERYAAQRMDVMPTTPAEFGKLMKSEITKWTAVVKAAKIPLM